MDRRQQYFVADKPSQSPISLATVSTQQGRLDRHTMHPSQKLRDSSDTTACVTLPCIQKVTKRAAR